MIANYPHLPYPASARPTGASAWMAPALLALFSFAVLLPACPALQPAPGQWGTWLLECLSLSAASFLLYTFLRRFFRGLPAVLAVFGLQANLVYGLDYGDSSQEYALLLQALILFLMVEIRQAPGQKRLLLALGAVTGLVIALEPALFATGLAALAFLLLEPLFQKSFRLSLSRFAWIGFGMAAVWAACLALFAAGGTWPLFLDQAFRSPFAGLQTTNPGRIAALLALLDHFRDSGFFVLGAASWLFIAPFLFLEDHRFRRALAGRPGTAVLVLAGLALLFNGLYNDSTGQLFSLRALSAYRVVWIAGGSALILLALPVVSGWLRRVLSPVFAPYTAASPSPALYPLLFALVALPGQALIAVLPGQAEPSAFLPLFLLFAIGLAFLFWAVMPGEQTTSDTVLSTWAVALIGVVVIGFGAWATISVVQTGLLAEGSIRW